jgi:gamma-glutamyl-gamma-aminobutyrate hydrolase PuuD
LSHKTPILKAVVTQRVDPVAGREEARDALDQRFTEWLNAAGLLPFPIPNAILGAAGSEGFGAWLEMLDPDILVLSGGNDIGEQPARDDTERQLLSWARDTRTPVLGICRGMQMMAVWAGGELIRVTGHVGCRHKLTVGDEKRRSEWPASVNSYHNWGLRNVPAEFAPVAWAEDGTIEAMRHDALPWEAWMWHPEREGVFDDADLNRIRRLIDGK